MSRRYGRITVEGWFDIDDDIGWCRGWTDATSESRLLVESRCTDHKFEPLPEPEPEVQFRDVWRGRTGDLWLGRDDGKLRCITDPGAPCTVEVVVRQWGPLTLLVRGGKSVTS